MTISCVKSDCWKQRLAKSALDAEVTRLKGELKVFQDKADADDAAARKKLLDDAEQDGRIDAATRPIYENLLAKTGRTGKGIGEAFPKT